MPADTRLALRQHLPNCLINGKQGDEIRGWMFICPTAFLALKMRKTNFSAEGLATGEG